MRDEDVCFYLKASVEGNTLARDTDGMSKEVADQINQALEDLSAMYGHSYIRTQIKSAVTGPLRQPGREEVSGT